MSSGTGGSGTAEQQEEYPPDKEYYSSNRAFLCICICIGCSYQCLTEFPYLVLSHGGACFLIPYTAVLVFLGIPMAAFEMVIGQFRGRGVLDMWSCVPIGKGVGMAMLLKTFVLTAYRAFQDGCSFYYFLQAFQEVLPWARCYTWWGASPLNCLERDVELSRQCYAERARLYNISQNQGFQPTDNITWIAVCGHRFRVPTSVFLAEMSDQCRETRGHSEYAFYLHGVLKLTRGIDEIGGIRWELLVCYIFTWFVIFVCSAHGVATVGKLSPLLAFAPLVLIVTVTARVFLLPGARSAIVELIYPRWMALFDLDAWGGAAFSVLTGLAVGVGQLQTMASYNIFDTYTLQWGFLLLPLVMTVSNLLCCLLVFSTGGYLARSVGACMHDFGTQTYVFPFVIFPEVVKGISWPRLWSGLFYSGLFLMSIDTMTTCVAFAALHLMYETEYRWMPRRLGQRWGADSILESNRQQIFSVCTVIACAEDLFPQVRARNNINKVAFFVCIGMFVSGFPTITEGGTYIVKLLEEQTVKGIIGQFIPLAEIVLIMYVYGIRRFSFDVEFMLSRAPNVYFRTCWTIVCPLALVVACIHTIRSIKTPVFFNVTIPSQYQALAWIVGCAGLLQIPIGAFSSVVENIKALRPEYQWEPNTVNRVNAYFEEIEDRGIQAGEESSGAEIQGVLYDATEALDISIDQDDPLVFRPDIG